MIACNSLDLGTVVPKECDLNTGEGRVNEIALYVFLHSSDSSSYST